MSKIEVETQRPAAKANARKVTTTEDIVQELLAKGVPRNKIRIPGHGKKDILYISDDFDAPLGDFEDYT